MNVERRQCYALNAKSALRMIRLGPLELEMVAQRVKASTIQKNHLAAETPLRFPTPRVRYVTRRHGKKLLNRAARIELGISADEFLRRLDSGYYANIEDDELYHRFWRVETMVPFVRRVKA